MKTIKQIVPADGWWADYTGDDEERVSFRVAVWALVKDDTAGTYVEGFFDAGFESGGLDACSEARNFSGYRYWPGQTRERSQA